MDDALQPNHGEHVADGTQAVERSASFAPSEAQESTEASAGEAGNGNASVLDPLFTFSPLADAKGSTTGQDRRDSTVAMGTGTPIGDFEYPVVPEMPDRYSDVIEHARGGMGRVLRARDHVMGREVAIKELYAPGERDAAGAQGAAQGTTIRRFLREALITSRLEHPAIVPVHELGQRPDGSYYYTMKLVRGRTLSHAIEQSGSLEERLKLLPNFVALCQAVAYAHEQGIINRDIKPSNVILGEFGETIVIDWGLAVVLGEREIGDAGYPEPLAALDASGSNWADATRAGEAVGTPSYMPPEQAVGAIDRIDMRSDVYALGGVLYALLTGVPPHTGLTTAEILAHARNAAPKPIHRIEPRAPRELQAIASKALMRDHEKRYQTAVELEDDVERFLGGALVESYEYPVSELVRRYAHRQRDALLATAALLLLLAGVAFFSFSAIVQQRDAALRARVLADSSAAVAETDRARAERAEAAALVAEQSAIEQRDRAEVRRYDASIGLAQALTERNRFLEAAQTLHDTPEPMRNWEWGWLMSRCQQARSTWNFAHLVRMAEGTTCDVAPNRGVIAYRSSVDTPYGIVYFERFRDRMPQSYVVRILHQDRREFWPMWSPDEAFLVCVSEDRLFTYHVDSNQWMATYNVIGTSRDTIAWGGTSYLAFLNPDLEVVLLAFVDGPEPGVREAGRWPTRRPPVSLAVSDDGSRVAIVEDAHDGGFVVNELAVGEPEPILGLADLATPLVAFRPGGRELLCTRSAPLRMVRVGEDGAVLHEFSVREPARTPSCLATKPNGESVVIGCRSGWIESTDLTDNEAAPVETLAHRGPITAMAWSADGKTLVTAGEDRFVRVWDGDSLVQRQALAGHAEPVERLVLASKDTQLFTLSNSETKLWNLDAPANPTRLTGHRLAALSGGIAHGRMRGITHDGRVVHYSDRGEVLREATLPAFGASTQVHLDPTGAHAVLLSATGARLAHIESGATSTLYAEDAKVLPVAFAPDGRHTVLVGPDAATGQTKAWLFRGTELVEHHTLLQPAMRYDYAAADVGFVSPTTWIVVWGGTASLFELGQPDPTAIVELGLVASNQPFAPMACAQQRFDTAQAGHAITAYLAADKTVRVYDVDAGGLLSVIQRQSHPVTALAFGDDGKRLFVGTQGGTLSLYNTDSGELLLRLPSVVDPVAEIRIDPQDGSETPECVYVRTETGEGHVFWSVPWRSEDYVADERLPFADRIEAHKLTNPLYQSAWDREQAQLLRMAEAKWEQIEAGGLALGAAVDEAAIRVATIRAAELRASRSAIFANPVGAVPASRAAGPLSNWRYVYEMASRLDGLPASGRSPLRDALGEELRTTIGPVTGVTRDLVARWVLEENHLFHAAIQLSGTLGERAERPQVDTMIPLGLARLEAGDYDGAIRIFHNARLADTQTLHHDSLALAYARRGELGDLTRSAAALQTYLESSPVTARSEEAYRALRTRAGTQSTAHLAALDRLRIRRLAPRGIRADYNDLDRALAAADQRNTFVLLVVGTRPSPRIDAFYREAYGNPYVHALLSERTLLCELQPDAMAHEERERLIGTLALNRFPAVLLLDTQRNVRVRLEGDAIGEGLYRSIVRPWSDAGRLRDWYVLGPVAETEKPGIEAAIESNNLGPSAAWRAGGDVRKWQQVNLEDPEARFVLGHYFEEPGIVYLHHRMHLAEGAMVHFFLDHQSQVRLWCDGTVLMSGDHLDAHARRRQQFLEAGEHTLVVCLETTSLSDFVNAVVRVEVQDVRNIPAMPTASIADYDWQPAARRHLETQADPPSGPGIYSLAGSDLPGSERQIQFRIVWSQLRPQTQADKLLPMYMQLNLRPVVDSDNRLVGITSDRFSNVPILRRLGLRDDDVLRQFEEVGLDAMFRVGDNGMLNFRPEVWTDLSGHFDKRDSYTLYLTRADQELELEYLVDY